MTPLFNPQNDAHILAIVTRNGRTLVKDAVDFYKGTNKRGNDEQENEKNKWQKKSNDEV